MPDKRYQTSEIVRSGSKQQTSIRSPCSHLPKVHCGRADCRLGLQCGCKHARREQQSPALRIKSRCRTSRKQIQSGILLSCRRCHSRNSAAEPLWRRGARGFKMSGVVTIVFREKVPDRPTRPAICRSLFSQKRSHIQVRSMRLVCHSNSDAGFCKQLWSHCFQGKCSRRSTSIARRPISHTIDFLGNRPVLKPA
jgi:hypothetical protein